MGVEAGMAPGRGQTLDVVVLPLAEEPQEPPAQRGEVSQRLHQFGVVREQVAVHLAGHDVDQAAVCEGEQ